MQSRSVRIWSSIKRNGFLDGIQIHIEGIQSRRSTLSITFGVLCAESRFSANEIFQNRAEVGRDGSIPPTQPGL